MRRTFTALSLTDLQDIRDAYIAGADKLGDAFLRHLEALNEAIQEALIHVPNEYVVLARGVTLKNERQLRKERAKERVRKLEETLQLYGMSVVPELNEHGRPIAWNVYSGHPCSGVREKHLKDAVAGAVAKEVKRRTAEDQQAVFISNSK